MWQCRRLECILKGNLHQTDTASKTTNIMYKLCTTSSNINEHETLYYHTNTNRMMCILLIFNIYYSYIGLVCLKRATYHLKDFYCCYIFVKFKCPYLSFTIYMWDMIHLQVLHIMWHFAAGDAWLLQLWCHLLYEYHWHWRQSKWANMAAISALFLATQFVTLSSCTSKLIVKLW